MPTLNFLDYEPRFDGCYWSFDGHFNERGNATASDILVSDILAKLESKGIDVRNFGYPMPDGKEQLFPQPSGSNIPAREFDKSQLITGGKLIDLIWHTEFVSTNIGHTRKE